MNEINNFVHTLCHTLRQIVCEQEGDARQLGENGGFPPPENLVCSASKSGTIRQNPIHFFVITNTLTYSPTYAIMR